MMWTPMPETSVHEDCEPFNRKSDIGAAGGTPQMDSVVVFPPVERATQEELGNSVRTANP